MGAPLIPYYFRHTLFLFRPQTRKAEIIKIPIRGRVAAEHAAGHDGLLHCIHLPLQAINGGFVSFPHFRNILSDSCFSFRYCSSKATSLKQWWRSRLMNLRYQKLKGKICLPSFHVTLQIYSLLIQQLCLSEWPVRFFTCKCQCVISECYGSFPSWITITFDKPPGYLTSVT